MREEFKKWNLFKDFNELLYFTKGLVSTIQMRVIIFCFCFFISIWFIWLFLFWFSFILIGISICQGLNLRCSEEIWRFRFPTINNYMHPWSAATILLPRTKIKDISCTTLYQMFIFIYFFFFPFFLIISQFFKPGIRAVLLSFLWHHISVATGLSFQLTNRAFQAFQDGRGYFKLHYVKAKLKTSTENRRKNTKTKRKQCLTFVFSFF